MNSQLKYLLVLFFPFIIAGRIYETDLQFTYFSRRDGWIYLDKITFQPGFGQVKLQTRAQGVSMGGIGQGKGVIFQIIPASQWQQQQRLKCLKLSNSPYFHTLSSEQINSTRMTDKTQVTISIQKQQIYYFVIKDCNKNLLAQYSNANLKLYIKLTITNNGKQLGAQQDHWYIVPIIIIAGLWCILYNKNQMKISGQSDWPKLMLFGGIATNISSLTWRTFGYIIYVLSGSDYIFFHLVYLFMHSISECFVIGLIIMISLGWSINYNMGRDFDLYLPVIAMFALVNILTTLLTKINNREHDRHHMFDSVPGFLLILFRATTLMFYIGGLIYTYRASRHRVKSFLIKFGVMGFLYISAMPLLVIYTRYYVEPMNQNEFLFVTVEFVKTLSNIILTYTISSTRAQYQNISLKNASFLPEDTRFH